MSTLPRHSLFRGNDGKQIDAVVIGGSAGGVEALAALLPALPVGLRAPVIVVLHLPRDKPSLLVEIFARQCVLPVEEAQDKAPIEPGTVYFAPADYHLLVDEGPSFALSLDEPVHYSRPSIDVLFETAAEVYGDHLLAIVLTGASQDGAAGLAAVHRAGGITAVQRPDEAPSPYMPESALRTSPVDHVLPLAGIAELIGTLVATRNA
jgi:two-component system chemotaxis response regulator CheB